MAITRPKGTNDFMPEEVLGWQYVENLLREICRAFGYMELRTPIFEETELFVRGVGDTTDIVQKEMYTFTDQGDRSLTLRPEGTASTVRAYLEHKLFAISQPTKLYYMGPMFRCEKPQAGRYRQFHQFGVEFFGSDSPAADAEVISLAWEFYRRLGLKGLEVRLNSVGCPVCRAQHRAALQEYLKPRYEELCPSCKSRYEKNPLRIFDCKSSICQSIVAEAPTILDCLCDDCRTHFAGVKSYLTAVDIPYQLDAHLVRGLDYYTNTAFEILVEEIGAQSAICGGGRYNGLIKQIGGDDTPGVGFALGLERAFAAMAAQGVTLPAAEKFDVYLAPLHPKADRACFIWLAALRQKGIAAEKDYLQRSLKAQMKYADKIKASYVVIVGETEMENGRVLVRRMDNAAQTEIPFAAFTDRMVEIVNGGKEHE